MSYSYPEIRNFSGLHLQANSLTVPDGALEEAENITISKDNKISKTRGFYRYFDPGSDTLNSLHQYQNKLIAIMSNKVRYLVDVGTTPNFVGAATTLGGVAVSVTGTRVAKSTQSNNNFYFTTDGGVKKLEAYNSDVFTAGAPPGLDLSAIFIPANGPIGGNTEVGYRLLFGRDDTNSNEILSAPSDIVVLTNSPLTLQAWSRTTNVVTVTSSNHGLTAGMLVSVSTSTGATPVAAGDYVVATVTPTTFTFADTNADSSGTLTWSTAREARLEFSIPSEITNVSQQFFVQIYRTSQTVSSSASPTSDFKLVDQVLLTAAQITARVGFYNDNVDDILLGAELYTNPNSREGELQANYRPPLCEDITLYKNHAIYANCTTRHLLDISVVDATALVNGDFIEVKVDATTLRYVARTGVGNSTVTATSVSGTGTVTITYNSHGLSNGDTVYISNVTGTIPEGTYTVSGAAANTFQIVSLLHTATALDFQGVTNGTYPIFQLDIANLSVAVQLRHTAQGIVKAINRDANSLIYASYTSLITDVPGKIRFQAKGFTGAINLRANTDTSGGGFSPVLPSSFASGTQVFSRNESQPHTFYAAKTGEPEAVPIVNNFPNGSRNKGIVRSVALRDSLILLKADGVFRVTGDNTTNFVTTILDNTVFCVAKESVQVLNNQVTFLSNQGVCLVTESSVQIISRKIEDVIQPVIGLANISDLTAAVAYESERAYFISTAGTNQTSTTVTYIYNILNDSWTSTTNLLKNGLVGPNDKLFIIESASGFIFRERKENTKIDYCGQNYNVTVTMIISNSAVEISTLVTPEIGDVVVKDNILNRITEVDPVGANYQVTFERLHNLLLADTKILYKGYKSTVKLAPYHGGAIGRAKQFAQMQIHLRDDSISKMDIAFDGYTYSGSESVTWASNLSSQGWGFSAWGFFPWGQQESLNLSFNTTSAPVIRTYVPKFQQRGTFIQPVLTHKQAGESLSIQAIAFSIRGYGERVSK